MTGHAIGCPLAGGSGQVPPEIIAVVVVVVVVVGVVVVVAVSALVFRHPRQVPRLVRKGK